MQTWTNGRPDVFVIFRTYVGANFWLNVAASFWMDCRAKIFVDRAVGICPDFGASILTDYRRDFRTNFGTNFRPNFRATNFGTKDFRLVNFWANGNGGKRIAAKNIWRHFGRRQFGMENRLSRRTDRGTLRQDRRSEHGSREGKVERFRLFRFQRLQFFLFAKLASDLAQRRGIRLRICVEACRRILRGRRRAIIFLGAFVSFGFDLRAVFGSQDIRMLEIFFGVNMLGALL